MFYHDCFITALSCQFPFRLKGFSVLATKVIFRGFGVTPFSALAVIDWGSSSVVAKTTKAADK
jgi:hypothetical protein